MKAEIGVSEQVLEHGWVCMSWVNLTTYTDHLIIQELIKAQANCIINDYQITYTYRKESPYLLA